MAHVRATPDLIAPNTPPDVEVFLEARAPDEPALGIPVTLPAARMATRPTNRLVTIGDSLTHGFQSGAIFNTSLSWPAIVSWEMGNNNFRFPRYDGFGGLPLNIEFVIRDLEERYGSSISGLELVTAPFRLRGLMAEIEDYWERGPGSQVPDTNGIMHNLAVYGWDLRDALSHTSATLAASIATPKNDFLSQIVQNANERAALRVYKSARDATGRPLTVFDAAELLGRDGADGDPNGDGIEVLVVQLGANNALGAVTSLETRWSDAGFDTLEGKRGYNVWRPDHFRLEFARVVGAVKKIRARHVIIGNVPHVTIAPLARGVATKVRAGSRYFPYYTRPWILDADFDAHDDPNITGNQARAVDSAIDQYNGFIAGCVRDARIAGLDWYVLDVAGLLDQLAARRYINDPAARPSWWTPYDLPPELKALVPVPDSNFFQSGPDGRFAGGLFALDGVHPTTICYGILAQEYIRIMEQAGVPFFLGNGTTRRPSGIQVDFKRLLQRDSLISAPPTSIASDLKLLGWLDESVDWVRRIVPFGG